MRLITSIGLSVLLIFGVAATAHGEFDSIGVGASTAADLVGSPDETALVDPDESEVVASPSGTNALVGAALCALGILCGLTALLLLLRVLWQPPLSSLLRAEPRFGTPPTAPIVRPRATAITLTQLGLSRT